jgi:hypothetical protein
LLLAAAMAALRFASAVVYGLSVPHSQSHHTNVEA